MMDFIPYFRSQWTFEAPVTDAECAMVEMRGQIEKAVGEAYFELAALYKEWQFMPAVTVSQCIAKGRVAEEITKKEGAAKSLRHYLEWKFKESKRQLEALKGAPYSNTVVTTQNVLDVFEMKTNRKGIFHKHENNFPLGVWLDLSQPIGTTVPEFFKKPTPPTE